MRLLWIAVFAMGCAEDGLGNVDVRDRGERDADADAGVADADAEATVPETRDPDPDSAPPEPDSAPATDTVHVPEITDGCFTHTAAGHHSVVCGDITFEVEVPAACLTRNTCGLIVDIHGLSMTAASEDANTDMRRRGNEDGYVVIQPTAPAPLGLPARDLEASDVPIFAFVAEVAEDLATDPERAHVMGFSQGGALTWSLVCKHADFFASAAPIGALPGCDFSASEHPSRELDVLVVHGRSDTIVAYSNLEKQRDDALAYWQAGQSIVIEADDAHEALRWTTPSGKTLEVWSHDYTAAGFILNGHCFPGSPDTTPQGLALAFGCQQPGTFDYAAMAMTFFKAHPR